VLPHLIFRELTFLSLAAEQNHSKKKANPTITLITKDTNLKMDQQPKSVPTVPVSILIVAIVLTALLTTAIFTCVTCIHARARTRASEYQAERAEIEAKSPVIVGTPYIVDLRASMAPDMGLNRGFGSTRTLRNDGNETEVDLERKEKDLRGLGVKM